eukprot:gnl/TRDRNA2_/TRDRNA2_173104_c0_seq1.p1 gnl/TRDRNA2_/TRDRNA2_173104_c0~~gnl/TRDRNA2_/TRDRNA2_173104_c0_seq1.p1  ORF type:complete len:297 (+),score=44.74 gnl/TRDRNA2_/TRDRNA2_173104_c0_seq1:128-1018(+)
MPAGRKRESYEPEIVPPVRKIKKQAEDEPKPTKRVGFDATYLPYAVNWKKAKRDYKKCIAKELYEDCQDGFTNQCCDRDWWCVGDYCVDYIDCDNYGKQPDGSRLKAYCCPYYAYTSPGFHEIYAIHAENFEENGIAQECYKVPPDQPHYDPAKPEEEGEFRPVPCWQDFFYHCCNKDWWCIGEEFHPSGREKSFIECEWFGTQADGSPLVKFCCPLKTTLPPLEPGERVPFESSSDTTEESESSSDVSEELALKHQRGVSLLVILTFVVAAGLALRRKDRWCSSRSSGSTAELLG